MCSTLTYWNEHLPLRVDLGMNKYGGSITVEEVEDVKTFYQLFSVIICAGGSNEGLLIDWYKLMIDEGFSEDSKS